MATKHGRKQKKCQAYKAAGTREKNRDRRLEKKIKKLNKRAEGKVYSLELKDGRLNIVRAEVKF